MLKCTAIKFNKHKGYVVKKLLKFINKNITNYNNFSLKDYNNDHLITIQAVVHYSTFIDEPEQRCHVHLIKKT